MNIIVSDLDKTLVKDFNSNLESSTIQVINRIREKDIFVLATGRVLKNVYKLNKEHNFVDYVIASNGAIIYDVKQQKIIAHKEIPTKIVDTIIKASGNKFYKFNLCTLNNWNRKENKNTEIAFNEIKLVENLEEISQKESIFKCEIYYDEMNDLISFYQQLLKLNLPLEYSIMTSQDEKNYIDITYKNINKKTAIVYLKNKLNADKVIAFGDNMNDYEMLLQADISICVDNSVPALKQVCNFVTSSVSELGVEKWLSENYLS